ncbi:MAG: 30S ribosomal protein S19 [Planctomycetes bacterium]|nr:30S ribosomal protein S19 [Planctomycetota bacterium]
MGRSIKKGPFVNAKLLKKVLKLDTRDPKPIKTWARDCTIIPEFVAKTFMVHTGKDFKKVYVTENMVGHKLGEFAPTRVFRGHSGKKKEEAAAAAGAAGGAAGASGAAGAGGGGGAGSTGGSSGGGPKKE